MTRSVWLARENEEPSPDGKGQVTGLSKPARPHACA
jgi:hypothetical protein